MIDALENDNSGTDSSEQITLIKNIVNTGKASLTLDDDGNVSNTGDTNQNAINSFHDALDDLNNTNNVSNTVSDAMWLARVYSVNTFNSDPKTGDTVNSDDINTWYNEQGKEAFDERIKKIKDQHNKTLNTSLSQYKNLLSSTQSKIGLLQRLFSNIKDNYSTRLKQESLLNEMDDQIETKNREMESDMMYQGGVGGKKGLVIVKVLFFLVVVGILLGVGYRYSQKKQNWDNTQKGKFMICFFFGMLVLCFLLTSVDISSSSNRFGP